MPPIPSHHPIPSQAPKPPSHFSWRTRARPLIVLAALLMASTGLDIAKAGFLDELFGSGEPMERYHYEGPRHFRPARHFWREYPQYGMSSEPRRARAAQWAEERGTGIASPTADRCGKNADLSAETGARAPPHHRRPPHRARRARPAQVRRLLLYRPPARRRRRPCRRAAARRHAAAGRQRDDRQGRARVRRRPGFELLAEKSIGDLSRQTGRIAYSTV